MIMKNNKGYTFNQIVEIENAISNFSIDFDVIFKYASPLYTELQLRCIFIGLYRKLNVDIYANPNIHYCEMYEIMKGLYNNVNVSLYMNKGFVHTQMEQIRLGLENGIDVSIYAKKHFNFWQMKQIRLGLETGLSKKDVSYYSNPEIPSNKMEEIRFKIYNLKLN